VRHVIVGDVHLTREHSAPVASALAALLRANAGAAVVFAGDLFDLAAETGRGTVSAAIQAVLGAHPALRSALASHLGAGAPIWLLGGNHDDELVTPEGIAAFAEGLGLDAHDRDLLHATPWFARLGPLGELHVEHGHHYDPDNAPAHPLAPPDRAWRSLGIGLMHAFVAPSGAHALVHANDRTPLQCLVRAVELFGPRAPAVIVRYFAAAAGELSRAGRRYPRARAHALGEAEVERFAARWALRSDEVRALVRAGATPTLSSLRATFFRLYWDRVAATAVASVAACSAALGGPGRRAALVAAGALAVSIAAGRNRYRGRVAAALAHSAEQIAMQTAARAVVFGHVHSPDTRGAYTNTGSFAFPGGATGRPYVLVAHPGARAEQRFFRAS
jgi:hypothetical protein